MWPPKTDQEFNAYLKYQKQEGLVLPLIPNKVKLNGKIIIVPDGVKEEISQSDDFVCQTRPIVEKFLINDYFEDFQTAIGSFEFCG